MGERSAMVVGWLVGWLVGWQELLVAVLCRVVELRGGSDWVYRIHQKYNDHRPHRMREREEQGAAGAVEVMLGVPAKVCGTII